MLLSREASLCGVRGERVVREVVERERCMWVGGRPEAEDEERDEGGRGSERLARTSPSNGGLPACFA